MPSVNGFLHRKLLLYAASLWVSVSALLFPLFGFFNKTSRVELNETRQRDNSNSKEQGAEIEDRTEQYSDCLEQGVEAEPKEQEIGSTKLNPAEEISVCKEEEEEEEEEDAPKFFFKFEYQIPNHKYEPVVLDSVSSETTNKYEFSSAEGSSLFQEKDVSFRVTELDAESVGSEEISGPEFDEGKEKAEVSEVKSDSEMFIEMSFSDKENAEPSSKIGHNNWGQNDPFLLVTSEVDSSSDSDFDSESISSSHEFFSRVVASSSDDFLSEKDIEEAFQSINSRNSEDLEFEDINSQISDEADSDTEDPNSSNEHSENNSTNENSDSNGLEALWEHQELIEQLKMELKKVRATGLPTILEDDESPKITDDLKPWKIDDKFHQRDKMGELHKFYRSYRERMRKFDILNYQKMYAIGFLQSKDPLKLVTWSSKAPSAPALTSLLSIRKRRKGSNDPTMSFIRELHVDLEVVYVGQMCLSWEILHWQYHKALEIWESDTHRIGRYNEVAGEFQQFQVLLQRFIENEPFDGPRIQNYAKNRCISRYLLQVPMIREDNMKDKKGRRNRLQNDYAIKSDALIEIVEESIRIFWRFVRADKDAQSVVQKSRKGTQVQPDDPTELELLTEVRTSLLKKERKLKEILRSGSCILRKFQKQKEKNNADQVLYFFSQVDMKLVARVLNMSKITTDQLLWCRSKLDKMSFVRRKIQVEPSFLLFPC